MSALMKKHHIKSGMRYAILHSDNGQVYRIPENIAKKYKYKFSVLPKKLANELFTTIKHKYTPPGVLLRGTRHREGMTQEQMAKKLNITQADLSKIENGKRHIGKTLAKRIEDAFGVDYHYFL